MVAVVDTKTLVLGAHEDSGQDETGDEKKEKAVVQAVVAVSVKDGEKDEASRPGQCKDDTEDAEHLLRGAGVSGQSARVSEPALSDKGQVEEKGRNYVSGDEKRF